LLVTGQMQYQPADHVLRLIEKAGLNNLSYEFYSFIFMKSWKELDVRSRKLLVAMLQFEGNPTADLLRSTSGMGEDIFYSAATELVQRSLLSVVIRAQKARYSMHPLTRYFISTDIAAKWD
jgi:hypothetical protein